MIELYGPNDCAFTERVRHVMDRLHVTHVHHAVDPDSPDDEFQRVSPTGHVPVFVEKDLRLFDSLAICEYLADVRGWAEAFDERPAVRARERQAMIGWDATVVSAFRWSCEHGDLGEHGRAVRLQLQELVKAIHATGRRTDNLLALHVAPWWRRIRAARDRSPLGDRIDEWIDLRAWLDAIAPRGAHAGV